MPFGIMARPEILFKLRHCVCVWEREYLSTCTHVYFARKSREEKHKILRIVFLVFCYHERVVKQGEVEYMAIYIGKHSRSLSSSKLILLLALNKVDKAEELNEEKRFACRNGMTAMYYRPRQQDNVPTTAPTVARVETKCSSSSLCSRARMRNTLSALASPLTSPIQCHHCCTIMFHHCTWIVHD
jgi:hypothetical protein